MAKEKSVSTLVGIIIIIAAAVVIFGGVFAYQYLAKINWIKNGVQVSIKDENCNGKNNPNYDLGFGIEHTYKGLIIEGDIKKNMYVEAVLSCDHKKITISGAVNQAIKSSDLAKYYNGENVDLIEPTNIDDNLYLIYDYNFDGYRDITVVFSRGQGISAIEYDLVFLYDSKMNKFIYQPDLSNLENVSARDSDKTIRQNFYLGYNQATDGSLGFNEITYKWNNNSLVKISDENCELVESMSSKEAWFYRSTVINFISGGSKKVVLVDQIKKFGDGSCFDGQP